MSAGKASSSRQDAEAAAELVLQDGGNCIDAVLAGFLAAAAVDEGSLLAPIAAIVGGVGRGARCIDGRALQPGVGTRRPRGTPPGQATPPAAFAAAPRTFGALALLHTHGAQKPLSALIRPAAAAARRAGAEGRAKLLSSFASRGPRALVQTEVMRALLLAAGPTSGGMLVAEDLEDLAPTDRKAHSVELTGGGVVAVPSWLAEPEESPERDRSARSAEVIVAADVSGSVAALAWSPDPEGVLVPELDVRLPRDGAPVVRGVPRIAPQSVRAASLPVGVLLRPTDGWYASIGVSARPSLGIDELDLGDDGLLGLLGRLADVQRGALAVAASVSKGKIQSLRVGGRR